MTLRERVGGRASAKHPGRSRKAFPCLWKREGRLKQRWRSHGCFYTFLSCWRGSVDIFVELKRKENSGERGELDMLMILCEILQKHLLWVWSRSPNKIPGQNRVVVVGGGSKRATRSRPAEMMKHSPEEKRCRQRCFIEVSPKQWGNDMRQMGLSRVSTRGTGKLYECEGSRVWSPVKWDDSSPFLLRDEQKQEEAIFSGEKAMLGKQAVFRKKKRLPSNKDRCLSRGFPFLNRRNLRNSSPLKYDQRCVLVLRVHVSRCLYTCMSR